MPLSPSSPAVDASPTLTVVVALPGPGAARGVERLDAWARQLSADDELRPVTADREVAATLRRRRRPVLLEEACAGVPELWARGMEGAAGDWVLTTLGDLEPGPRLLRRVRQVLRDTGGRGAAKTPAAIGGRIAPPAEGAGAGLWALYLLRYGGHLHPAPPAEVEDLAADFAVYRRDRLERHRDAWIDGFWEPELHRRLVAEGERLCWRPDLEARLVDSCPVSAFVAQRYRHGRRYGADRLRGVPLLARLPRLASVPLVPPLFVLRALRRLGPGGLRRPRRWRALPWVLAFATAWALGEGRGYLSPLSENVTGNTGTLTPSPSPKGRGEQEGRW